jgi:2-polyprenyl-3-methyl-5-hydroxy-6-metoxy-1,4-benzoquinol methylase
MICNICGSERLIAINFSAHMISSDIRATDIKPRFLRCANCHTLQKEITPELREATARIYADYQDDGGETAPLAKRFETMIRLFGDVPQTGRLLDIGCGPGHFLRRFHELRPEWSLAAAELSSKWRTSVLAIPGVEQFYFAPFYSIQYDMVVLSHVLEHAANPVNFLLHAAKHVVPGGKLFVAAPNYRRNAADLVIVDHLTHFDCESLAQVVTRSGLQIDAISVGKEIFALLSQHQLAAFDLLEETRKEAREIMPDGIMGSSIASLWLAQELGRDVKFYVDEDKTRVGSTLDNRLILSPEQVPAGSKVFIPLSEPVAKDIIGRWKHLPIEFSYVSGNGP